MTTLSQKINEYLNGKSDVSDWAANAKDMEMTLIDLEIKNKNLLFAYQQLSEKHDKLIDYINKVADPFMDDELVAILKERSSK